MIRPFFMAACASWVLACAPSETVTAIVVDANVSSACIDGTDACERPSAISVGHCGPSAGVRDEENGGEAYATTEGPADEIDAIVSVRHDDGDQPTEAANGGSKRGYLVGNGERANIELFYRPSEILYSLGADGAPADVRDDLVRRNDGDVLEFSYEEGEVVVTEVHTIREIATRPLEIISPDNIFYSCCASIGRSDVAAWTVLALLTALLRRRPL